MVRALLAGRKTQTRRIIKPQPKAPFYTTAFQEWRDAGRSGRPSISIGIRQKPGDRLWVREAWRVSRTQDDRKPSELHARQMTTLYAAGGSMGGVTDAPRDGSVRPATDYVLDEAPAAGRMPGWAGRLRPGMFMPRWASRLTLTVTDVRVERLQDISEADAVAEGILWGTWADIIADLQEPDDAGLYPPDTPIYAAPDDDRDDHVCMTAVEAYRRLWESINGPGSWAANPWVVAISFEIHRGNIDALPAACEPA